VEPPGRYEGVFPWQMMGDETMGSYIIRNSVLRKLFANRVIPEYVQDVLDRLDNEGYDAFIVGGCVRDLFLGRSPKDWDVATNAKPEAVTKAFERTVPTGVEHGTVTVLVKQQAIEVTTYRVEGEYTDHRRPDSVDFTADIHQDLARRDLTINAMALNKQGALIDFFDGLSDIKKKLLRAVGDPLERFEEDALRMLRVVRFAAELGFSIDTRTFKAAEELAPLIERISWERIRDELTKALMSPRPSYAAELMRETGLLKYIIPELIEGVGCDQNKHHKYTVWEHNLIALENAQPNLGLRLAALLHDVAKPRCLTEVDGERHFFDHEHEGARMARVILKRLRYPKSVIDRVTHLIRYHMALHYDPSMKDSAIRRLISRVGLSHMPDLLELRRVDRLASGMKKGPVSKGTLKLLNRIDRVIAADAAFSVKDLAVDGNDVMEIAGIAPSPEVGKILSWLLEEVLEDPNLNTRPCLEAMITEYMEQGPDSHSK